MWSSIVMQLRDPLVLVLLAARVHHLTGDFTDAAVILFVVVVNTTVGVVQEVKADGRSPRCPADRTPRRVSATASRAWCLAADLVPATRPVGEGDIVPADAPPRGGSRCSSTRPR